MDKENWCDDNGFPIPISVGYDTDIGKVIDAVGLTQTEELIDHHLVINPAVIGFDSIEYKKEDNI